MSQRKVVITGFGLITPCGNGWNPYWQAVKDAKSFIRFYSDLPENEFQANMVGKITHFNPSEFVKQRKLLKVMSREIQIAMAASQLAVEDAKITSAQFDPFRFGISIGTGIINNELDEMGLGIRNSIDLEGQFQMSKFGQDGIKALYPLWMLKYLPNMPACHISIAHGLRGPSNTITTSAAAGTQAIGEAFRVIKRGDADLMIAGGTDSKVNPMGIARFNLLGLLSSRQESPETAYRPFDEKRDGLVIGEGAGLLILEEKQHALKRGARIYGEIAGYGAASDFNYDPRQTEDFTGKCLSMARALNEAEREPEDIDFLIANGSGVPQEDIQEASAIHEVFGPAVGDMLVTAVKPVTGHLIYASGGVEMAAGVLGLREGVVPPVANLETPDAQCNLPFVTHKLKANDADMFLINSFGFGGQNACLAVKK